MRRAALMIGLIFLVAACSPRSGTTDAPSATPPAVTSPAAPTESTAPPTVHTTAAGGGAIGTLLAATPELAADRSDDFFLSFGDIARASEAVGLARPTSVLDSAAVKKWLLTLSGIEGDDAGRGLRFEFPKVFATVKFAQLTSVHDELGWTILDVDRYLSVHAGDTGYSVMQGRVAPQSLDTAMGPAVNGVWRLGADDNGRDMKHRSAARPNGEFLRFGLSDGLLAVARSTPVITDFLGGSAPSLADDPGLEAVAKALDSAQVYTATLLTSRHTKGLPSTLPAAADLAAKKLLMRPFDTMAIGVAVGADGSIVTFAYHQADAATAAANAKILANILATAQISADGKPYTDLLQPATITTDGATLIATAYLQPGLRPDRAFDLALENELVDVHS